MIRTRETGDRIRPFGMQGRKKLQDYLTDRGIDEPWRDSIPLLCRDGEVIWVCGVGTGAIPRWENDGSRVRVICKGNMPWKTEESEAEPT
jgi:tRNA(Ile)-lysidine synthase